MVGGVILSAGRSSRIGSPKALLIYQGQYFLDRITGAFRAAGLEPVIVVLGPLHSQAIQNHCRLSTEMIVENLDQNSAMMASIQLAVARLPRECTGVVIQPVDLPLIEAATISLLVTKLLATEATIVRPRLQDRSGHPILLHRRMFDRIIRAAPETSLRELVDETPEQEILSVEVTSASVRIEVDTPHDLEKLRMMEADASDR